MTDYKIIPPREFSFEHIQYINNLSRAIKLVSDNSNDIIGFKDVNSVHVSCSSQYAKIVGLTNAQDISGRSDFDMPCSGTTQYASQYIEEDRALIYNKKINVITSVLNIHHYSDGLKARIFKKRLLFHEATHAILGTMYSGNDVEIKNFLNIIPSYIIQFGALGSMESSSGINEIGLNNYEQEICFLLILNWDFKQIATFMNEFRPELTTRTADTIIKKRNYICHKLSIDSNMTSDLCEYLVSIGFHNKIPVSFYSRIIGSKVLGEESVIA